MFKRIHIYAFILFGILSSCGCASQPEAVELAKRGRTIEQFEAHLKAESPDSSGPLNLTPGWFSNSGRLYWAGLVDEGGFVWLQKPIVRALSVGILLFPLSLLIIRSYGGQGQSFSILSDIPSIIIVIGCLFGPFPIGFVLSVVFRLLAFGIGGEGYWIASGFFVFCFQFLFLLIAFGLTLSPIRQLSSKGFSLKAAFGIGGLILEGFGIIFTIRDIIGLMFR